MFDTRAFGSHIVLAEDIPLVSEALRRVEALKASPGVGSDRIIDAIVGELRQGRRDLFGLFKAGRRAATTGQ
jgi:hypothetical protein